MEAALENMSSQSGVNRHLLIKGLREEVGEDLRMVTTYTEESYEVLFVRDDIDAAYSAEGLDVIFEELRLEGWGRERLEDLFYAGSLEWNLYGFEQAMMLHFVTNDFDGVFVTYDRTASLDVERVIDVCGAHL